MKLGPISKLDKKHTTTLKQIGDGVMSTNCDIIVFFPTYGQMEAKFQTDGLYKFIFRLIVTFYLAKLENSSHTIALSKGIFCQKVLIFGKEC